MTNHRFDTSGHCFECDQEATPSQYCKANGLRGITHLAELTGESRQTLINWHKNRPRTFKLLVLGAYYEN